MTAKRKALLALLLTAPAPSIGAAVAFHLAPGTVGNLTYAACKVVLYGMPWLWLRLVERAPISFSPLRKDQRRAGLGFGVSSGLLVAGLVFLVDSSMADWSEPTAIQRAASEAGIDTPLRYLLLAAHLCLVNALLEEYAFRWFLYGRCRELLARRAAIVLAAAIFCAHHVIVLAAFFDAPLVALASAGVFTGGVLWTWCYERYGSIWPGYVSHAIVDMAILTIGWERIFGW